MVLSKPSSPPSSSQILFPPISNLGLTRFSCKVLKAISSLVEKLCDSEAPLFNSFIGLDFNFQPEES
ncbi:hypothetical protein I3842_03G265900 [Carya illinoinensis]|uniref:Uncharacterized protein n=1 Tax=Carya illinoinensis TaxID=32201 RepID=A0A922JY61_CARIL|nr:hypothetical protein I3842_03G265900 [Carya illinoinensis]